MNETVYVLTCEHCMPNGRGYPVVLEQRIDMDYASLENIKAFKKRLGDKYGKIRIAKLVFIED